MKKKTPLPLVALMFVILTGCTNSNSETTTAKAAEQKPEVAKSRIWLQRNGNSVSLPEDSLKASFAVKDPVDSVLRLLCDSMQRRGKYFQPILAAFEKVINDSEIICYLYPEFYSEYSNSSEPSGEYNTKMTIRYLKKSKLQRDTLVYAWVEGDERKSSSKPERRTLKKNSFYVEIGTPSGYNNARHQAKTPNEVAVWVSNLLCDDKRGKMKDEADAFYDSDMQLNNGCSISFRGIHSMK